MDKIIINGNKNLYGTVKISGSKNAALPIFAATLLSDDEIILENTPRLQDIKTMKELLAYLGKKIVSRGDKVIITSSGNPRIDAPYDLVRKMRASAVVMGPLLARYGQVKVALPGGCAIGARPINIHLDGFKALGAHIDVFEGYVHVKADKLKGTKIVLEYPSVGATQNIMMAAVLAEGVTVIENAAREPEISDLANLINKMGGNITGIDSSSLVIEGVKELHGVTHSIIPDRIEAGTFMIAVGIAKGKVVIENAVLEHLGAVVSKLIEAGVDIKQTAKGVEVECLDGINPVDIETTPYPGFPTDMQAQWMALMCTARGGSVVTETVFENRFMHVAELLRMGAHLKIRGNTVVVRGNDTFSGAEVMSSDLRASAALVLAGLAAKGSTTVARIYHLDRGYENIEAKLQELGADITRVK